MTETKLKQIQASEEFIAVILAATSGARLYPLTTTSSATNSSSSSRTKKEKKQYRKHLLPIGGIPIIQHLVNTIEHSGFEKCIIIHDIQDDVTPSLFSPESVKKITFYSVDSDSLTGSADAIRQLHEKEFLPQSSNVMVLPGDLLLEGRGVLGLLCTLHRQNENGCTILMENSGEENTEDGVPLKESAKAKKGGYAREEEDVEYVAFAKNSSRLLFKKSKIDVEEDTNMDGTTPKVSIPLSRLLLVKEDVEMRMDLNDLHVYIFSPWMLQALCTRTKISNLQMEFLPLLISRQFRAITTKNGDLITPVQHVFGGAKYWMNEKATDKVLACTKLYKTFGVYTHIIPRGSRIAVRCSNISSYLFANRMYLLHLLMTLDSQANSHKQKQFSYLLQNIRHNPEFAYFPISLQDSNDPVFQLLQSTMHKKFASLIYSPTIRTDKTSKLTCKNCVIGKYVKIGQKCRFSNVIILDHVTIGDNVTLQNTIVGEYVTIGDYVSLNDVQVGHGTTVENGTKLKNESIVLEEENDYDHDHGDSLDQIHEQGADLD